MDIQFVVISFSLITQVLNRKYFCKQMNDSGVGTLVVNLDKGPLRALPNKPRQIVFCITNSLGSGKRLDSHNLFVRRTLKFLFLQCDIKPEQITVLTFTPLAGVFRKFTQVTNLCKKHGLRHILVKRHQGYIKRNQLCNEKAFLNFLSQLHGYD